MRTTDYLFEALAEYEKQLDYYLDQDAIEKHDLFVSEIQTAIQKIIAYPHRWKKIQRDLHSFGPTKKFKYRIGYSIQPAAIVIVAIYYAGTADPLYWLERNLD